MTIWRRRVQIGWERGRLKYDRTAAAGRQCGYRKKGCAKNEKAVSSHRFLSVMYIVPPVLRPAWQYTSMRERSKVSDVSVCSAKGGMR